MFDVIEYNFTDPDVKIRFICAELTLFSVENEARQLRRHILSLKTRKYSFLQQLIHVLHTDEEVGVKNIVTDVLRTLLEGEPQESMSPERDLMTIFYQDFFKTMMEPLLRPIAEGTVHSEAEGVLKNNLLDLLGFFVHHHGYRIKYEILKAGFLQKTLELLKCRDKHLVLASLRFFRALIGTSDKFYCKHIVKENLFEPVIQLFLQYEARYNLINSAILELFSFIRKENIRTLVSYIMQSFYERVKHIKYSDIFEQLKIKFEQNESLAGEASSTHSGVATPTRGSRGGSIGANRIISEDQERFSRYSSEENYFDGDDDDDEDLTPPLSLASNLVTDNLVKSDNSEAPLRTPGLSSIFIGLDDDNFSANNAAPSDIRASLHQPSTSEHTTDEHTDFGPTGGAATSSLVPYGADDETQTPKEPQVGVASANPREDMLNGSFDEGDLPQGSRKKRKSDVLETSDDAANEPPSPKRQKESSDHIAEAEPQKIAVAAETP